MAANLQMTIDEMAKSLQQFKQQFEEKDLQIVDLKKLCETKDSDMGRLTEENSEKDIQIAYLAQLCHEKNSEFRKNIALCNEKTDQIATLTLQGLEKDRQISKLMEEMKEQAKARHRLNQVLMAKRAIITDERVMYETLVATGKASSLRIESLVKSEESLKCTLEQVESECELLKEEKKANDDQAKVCDNEYKKLLAEKIAIKEKYSRLIKHVVRMLPGLYDLIDEIPLSSDSSARNEPQSSEAAASYMTIGNPREIKSEFGHTSQTAMNTDRGQDDAPWSSDELSGLSNVTYVKRRRV